MSVAAGVTPSGAPPLTPAGLARFLVAFAVYGLAGLTVPAMLLFFGGIGPFDGVEHGPPSGVLAAVAVDLALLAALGLQHSGMARPSFKAWTARVVPPALERSVYVAATCGVVWATILAWRPVGPTLVRFDGAAGTVITVAYWCGVVMVYGATLALGHTRLLGLRQGVEALTGTAEPPDEGLRTGGVYALVRHPIMLGLVVCAWASPTVSVGRIILAVGITTYVAVGTWLEERDLVRTFGDEYRTYRDRVPSIVPTPRRAPRRNSVGHP